MLAVRETQAMARRGNRPRLSEVGLIRNKAEFCFETVRTWAMGRGCNATACFATIWKFWQL